MQKVFNANVSSHQLLTKTKYELQMITTKNKKLVHKSVFQLKNVRYNSNVDDSIFETEVMQRGL